MPYAPASVLVGLLVAAPLDGTAEAQANGPCRGHRWTATTEGILDLEQVPAGDDRAVLQAADALYRALHVGAAESADRLWAPGAEGRTRGRQATADAYDVVQSVEAVRAARRAELAARVRDGDEPTEEDDTATSVTCATASIDGDAAIVRGVFVATTFYGEEALSEGVEIRLRRVDRSWRVRSIRQWPVRYASMDELTEYGPRHWRTVDARVARARAGARAIEGARRLGDRLVEARRYAEAFDVVNGICARDDAQSHDCWTLEWLAWTLGREADARQAAARALVRARADALWFERGASACPRGATLVDQRNAGDEAERAVFCRTRNGERVGPATFFHANGQPARTGQLLRGDPTGWWIELDESGRFVRRRIR
jgi:hypothetical protein